MLLLVDELILLSSRYLFWSEFVEALSCDEREEVMVLAQASVRRLDAQGQVLASFILLLVLWPESIANHEVGPECQEYQSFALLAG